LEGEEIKKGMSEGKKNLNKTIKIEKRNRIMNELQKW
jgi:hypothetical protein